MTFKDTSPFSTFTGALFFLEIIASSSIVKESSFRVENPLLQTVKSSNPCGMCKIGGQVDLNGNLCGADIYISNGDICKKLRKGA